MPKRARLERVPLGPGTYVLVAREVSAAVVDFQPGDRSVETAAKRAIPVQTALARRDPVPPPALRLKPNGRFEVWDGNARVTAFRELGEPFEAVVVSPTGVVERNAGAETVPLEPDLWDQLVAQARSLVDAGHVSFRWPSPAATDWVTREYLAAGGRFGRRRAARAPRLSKAQREQLRTYQELFADVDTAPDLYSLATILERGRELGSPVLRAVVTRKVVERGGELGFRCPGVSLEVCGDRILEYAATRQGRLFNPRLKRRLLGMG